jgi:hypothetical protein
MADIMLQTAWRTAMDPMDPMDLEMSIGISFVHWIQWTSGISIGHFLFQLVN